MSGARKRKLQHRAVSIPQRAERICSAIAAFLEAANISAKYEYEELAGAGVFRLFVIAPKFKYLDFADRQSLIWRAAATAPASDMRFVTMILTLTPSEYKQW